MLRIGKRKAGRYALGAATLVVGAATALLAVAFVPTLFGYEALVVTGGSMGKAVPAGSVALTRLREVASIGIGDVVTFRHEQGGPTITHRVVEASREDGMGIFRTKGDANDSSDPEPLMVSGRIHRVEHVVPLAGTLVGFAQSSGGAVGLLVLPIAGLVWDGRRKRLKATAPSAGVVVGTPPGSKPASSGPVTVPVPEAAAHPALPRHLGCAG